VQAQEIFVFAPANEPRANLTCVDTVSGYNPKYVNGFILIRTAPQVKQKPQKNDLDRKINDHPEWPGPVHDFARVALAIEFRSDLLSEYW